jgi:hypothetical protein
MVPFCLVVAGAALGGDAPEARRRPTPEARALAYLAREVPRWAAENKCYSCHNNGDAARALYAAVRQGRAVPPGALADTTRWLARPAGWDHNGGEGAASDKKLAALQFAAALAEAVQAGQVKEAEPPALAARRVAELQDKDGSWQVDSGGHVGSPATHGTALATSLARRTLRRADPRRYEQALARADAWVRRAPVKTVLDAAAVLLALGQAEDAQAVAQRRHCLALVRKGESKEGGWGPYVTSLPEAFDTAVVLLALAAQRQTAEVRALRGRGRAFLVAAQEEDGSWRETTRPAGAESYAQRLSTTGWATLALLATDGR